MEKKIKYICSECGSEKIKFDAWAEWDSETQQMKVMKTFDYTYCENCEGECRVKEVEI